MELLSMLSPVQITSLAVSFASMVYAVITFFRVFWGSSFQR